MTAIGPISVIVHGDRSKPAILTYHDIGMTSEMCFGGFFNFPEAQPIMKEFCIYHVHGLGQEDGAKPLAKSDVYPTMDQLALSILEVLQKYNLKMVIGFGVGAGANILARFALSYPEKVEGLVLVNGNVSQCGWLEWAYQKWNNWYLKSNLMTAGVEEYLLWYWMGMETMLTKDDLVNSCRENVKHLNALNLGHFIDSYIKRTDLGIWRDPDPKKMENARNFGCRLLIITGENSPHFDNTVEMISRVNAANCDWVKFKCGGLILDECPYEFCEPFALFLRGLGYHLRKWTPLPPMP